MQRNFGRAGERLSGLIAPINQPLMHSGTAGGKECELGRIPERSVKEVDAAKLAPALCG